MDIIAVIDNIKATIGNDNVNNSDEGAAKYLVRQHLTGLFRVGARFPRPGSGNPTPTTHSSLSIPLKISCRLCIRGRNGGIVSPL